MTSPPPGVPIAVTIDTSNLEAVAEHLGVRYHVSLGDLTPSAEFVANRIIVLEAAPLPSTTLPLDAQVV